ncbi:class D beta-lactamase [Nostoc cycadae]|uniref:Beta-lactamase n=1 Tax=Nostoc cycadae WK-1 TaxID=1861711 RepID=A0A2H6LFR3_9NOSO|nr:class D beta-lactamase [Nostoc cycadae]GBE92061.1 beta-lactamase [Nostoc cycadae WK-1]
MIRSERSLFIISITIISIITLLTFTSLPGISATSKINEHPSVIAQSVNLGAAFKELNIEGSILIYDQNNQKFYQHNASRNSTAFLPASTFKILNSLISLETGVIKDEIAILTWDGIMREFPTWNRDTNMRQAYKDSTVWFYQVLARRVGHERMQQFINQVGYGNRQIGTPEQIDKFWLSGPLQITPKQQIEFLQRLYRRELPFSQRTFDLVQDIMILEKTPNYILRAKTGWATSVKPNIGWFVGYLEQNNNVYFFATNIYMKDTADAPKRIELTRRSFKALGLL